MAGFKFTMTDVKPVAARTGKSAEITPEREAVLDAFRSSMKEGTEDAKGVLIGKSVTTTVPDIDSVKELRKHVAWAAKQEEMGSRFRFSEDPKGALEVFFWAVSLTEKLYVECPVCAKQVQVTEDETVRMHGPKDERCEGSGAEVQVGE